MSDPYLEALIQNPRILTGEISGGVLGAMKEYYDSIDGTPPEDVQAPEPDPDQFVRCDELFSGRRGVPFSTDMRREYVRRFRVVVTNKYWGPVAIAQAPCLPFPYAPYVAVSPDGVECDLTAVCVSIVPEVEHEDEWKSWIVTCNYSTEVVESGPDSNVRFPGQASGSQNQPWLEPAVIEWDSEESSYAPPFDNNGFPFVNTAGQPFSPAPTFPVAHPVLVVSRNQQTFSPAVVSAYSYAVNSVDFMGNPPGTCQVMPPRAKLMWRGRQSYYRTTWRVKIKTNFVPDDINPEQLVRDVWQPRILDAGSYQLQAIFGLVPIPKSLVPIYIGGQPVSQPVMLDGHGRKLEPDADGKWRPVYLRFDLYPEKDLNDLFTNMSVP